MRVSLYNTRQDNHLKLTKNHLKLTKNVSALGINTGKANYFQPGS